MSGQFSGSSSLPSSQSSSPSHSVYLLIHIPFGHCQSCGWHSYPTEQQKKKEKENLSALIITDIHLHLYCIVSLHFHSPLSSLHSSFNVASFLAFVYTATTTTTTTTTSGIISTNLWQFFSSEASPQSS